MSAPSHRPGPEHQTENKLTLETITLIAGVIMLGLVALTLIVFVAEQPGRLVAQTTTRTTTEIASPLPPPIPTAIPTKTFTPSATPTNTLTPTATPTRTLTPTDTLTPSNTPTLSDTLDPSLVTPATATLRPTRTGPTPIPSQLPPYYVRLWHVDAHLRTIYKQGVALGNDPHRFSKIGDSESWSPRFLHPFEGPGYNLGNFQYLQTAINHFHGSFVRGGYAAKPGFASGAVLDPQWSDIEHCKPQETPLACEYRENKPAIALIMLRTWNSELTTTQYYYDLCAIVDYSLKQGVIPVLSTVPYAYSPWPPSEDANEMIRLVAYQYDVPLWDLWETTETLPGHGVDQGDNHLSKPSDEQVGVFVESYLQYGTVRRNLEALQVLDAILMNVIVGG